MRSIQTRCDRYRFSDVSVNIHHLDKEVLRKTCLNHQTLICVGDETVRVAGNDRQTNGRKDTVGVDPNFMTTDTCCRPATIVEEHFECDVIPIKGPVESNWIELVGVRIKERRIQIKRTVGRYTISFTVKGDEGQSSRTYFEGAIGGEHRPCTVVKPTAFEAP